MHSVALSILGSSFTIQSNYDAQYMERVVEHLKEKIREVQAGNPVRDPLKIALLAALNLTDELLRERSEGAREIEQITERLIERIDRTLVEN